MNFSWVLFCESVITGSHAVIMHVRIWIYSNVTLLNSLFTRLAMHFIWTRYISFSNYNFPNPIYLQPICPRPQYLVYVRNMKKLLSASVFRVLNKKTMLVSAVIEFDSKLSVFRSWKMSLSAILSIEMCPAFKSNWVVFKIVNSLMNSYEFMWPVMSQSGRSLDSKTDGPKIWK